MSPEIAKALADVTAVVESRSGEYTDGHNRHAAILATLFPNGIPTDKGLFVMVRFVFIFNILTKIIRFCDNLSKREGHPDSRVDLLGYALLLEAFDTIGKDDSL
jgi:hypothetical protein